jgi:MFS family permease
MFLTFAIVGAWQPILAKHLKNLEFTPREINWVMGATALATLISPLAAGQAVDRWWRTERVLFLGNLGTGIFLWLASSQKSFGPLFGLALGASLFSVISPPLGASMAFRHLPDGPRQFPAVRMWGTIGWVAGAWALGAWLRGHPGRGIGDGLKLAAWVAGLNALYSLTLPPTPPRRERTMGSAFGKALGMTKDSSFLLFATLMFLLAMFSNFYYSNLPIFLSAVGIRDVHLSGVISIGQMVEIPAVFLLPWVYSRIGSKGTLLVGIAAWVARFFLFARGHPPAWVIVGLALHGPCFAFGRIGATLYVERVCPPDARASAQAFLSLVMDGAGMLAGALVAAEVSTWLGPDWTTFWTLAGAGTGGILLVFAALFRPPGPAPRGA